MAGSALQRSWGPLAVLEEASGGATWGVQVAMARSRSAPKADGSPPIAHVDLDAFGGSAQGGHARGQGGLEDELGVVGVGIAVLVVPQMSALEVGRETAASGFGLLGEAEE